MRAFAVVISVLFLGALASCDEDFKDCYDGDYVACSCGGETTGYARCSGERYGACVCDGTTPGIDGGAEASQ